MLRAAIIGCGKIADSHAEVIERVGGCEIAAVCDREPLMMRQLCARFAVKGQYTDVAEMLEKARPDVVHITTPPGSHYEIARLCLEHGSNVYVEKPFTVYQPEAESLVRLAEKTGLRLTVGHNYQFTHAARRLRALAESGYLGGAPVHMESYYGYSFGDAGYARALLGDKQHWVRKLPGKLLQNVISHAVARIAEYLPGDSPSVTVRGFTSRFLKSIHEDEIVDELRVILCDGDGATAYLTFSSQMKPSPHEFRVYGPKNGLFLDQHHEIVLKLPGKTYPSFADKFIPPVAFAKQHLGNLAFNMGRFLHRDFHLDSGMTSLIRNFYASIREGSAPPIPYREILLTATIMEKIFSQLDRPKQEELRADTPEMEASPAVVPDARSR